MGRQPGKQRAPRRQQRQQYAGVDEHPESLAEVPAHAAAGFGQTGGGELPLDAGTDKIPPYFAC